MQHPHSKLGIASFIMSVVITALIFLAIIFAGVMATSTGGVDETSTEAIILGLVIIGMLLLDLVALGLGIGAIFQKDRNKLFAILGIIISAVTLLGTISLIVIGNTMAKRSDRMFASPAQTTRVHRARRALKQSIASLSHPSGYVARSRSPRQARLYWDKTPTRHL